MNQMNSTIELSSSFQPEMRQGRDMFYLSNALCEWHQIWLNESFKLQEKFQENQLQTKLLFMRTIPMVKIDNKIFTSSSETLFQSSYQTMQFQRVIPNKSKHIFIYQTRVNTFSEFISNITETFRELLPTNTTHFSRHQTILTFFKSQ